MTAQKSGGLGAAGTVTLTNERSFNVPVSGTTHAAGVISQGPVVTSPSRESWARIASRIAVCSATVAYGGSQYAATAATASTVAPNVRGRQPVPASTRK